MVTKTILSHPEKSVHVSTHAGCAPAGKSPTSMGGFKNYFEKFAEGDRLKVIKVGFPISLLNDALHEMTAGWPKRANGLLFVEGANHEPV